MTNFLKSCCTMVIGVGIATGIVVTITWMSLTPMERQAAFDRIATGTALQVVQVVIAPREAK